MHTFHFGHEKSVKSPEFFCLIFRDNPADSIGLRKREGTHLSVHVVCIVDGWVGILQYI